jgi:hypothetical protein
MTVPHFPPGQILDGKYTIRAELGRGPASVTYSALAAPNRELAIRVLDPQLPHLSHVVEHLQRVASATLSLSSRRILPIVDLGTDPMSRATYVVSPLVEVPSLSQLVSLCPLTREELPAFIVDLAQAIEELHTTGVLHLGLTPSNVFVGPNQRARLVDAGIHAVLSPAASAPGPSADMVAMAALFFYAATGHALQGVPAASARAKELGVELPIAIDEPLRHADRFPSPSALAQRLVEALEPGALPVPVAAPAYDPPPPPIPVAAPAYDPPPPPIPVAAPSMPLPPPMTLEASFEEPQRPPRRRGLVIGLALGGFAVMATLGIVLAFASRQGAAPIAAPAVSMTAPPIASVSPVVAPAAPATSSEPPPPRPPPPPPADEPAALALAAGEGELRVVCEPVACTNIAIDGKLGTNQGPFALKAGKHGIGVSAPGYGGQWELASVTAGQRTVLRFTLGATRSAPPKSCGKFLDRCN